MEPKKKNRLLEVSIETIGTDGEGIAHYTTPSGESKLIEIPFTMIGDDVEVELIKKGKGPHRGSLLTIKKPSSQRIEPRCVHFGRCGGCRWQHIPYEEQLAIKESWIKQLLAPYLKPSVDWRPILPSIPHWRYRNKMEFSFSENREGERFLGLIIQGSRGRVIQLTECHLVNPWFVQTISVVSDWWARHGLHAYHPMQNKGSLRTLTLREGLRTGDRMVMLTLSGNPEYALHRDQIDDFVSTLRQTIRPEETTASLSIFLRIQQVAKGHPTNFYEMHLDGPDHIKERLHITNEQGIEESLEFQISPTAFFQPNTNQAERIYQAALEMAEITKNDLVYDLYCGTGTLGLCAAKRAKEVVGIEIVPESVLDARENIKLNKMINIRIHQGDVGAVLEDLLKMKANHPDVVMVDPPRVGLDAKAIQYLIELNASKIVYISCNPSTQAVNLEQLINAGYQLKSVQPVDQFPHTKHVENIVLLTR